MITVKMKRTDTAINEDGVLEVFGKGKTYTRDKKVLSVLIDNESAQEIKKVKTGDK